MWILANTFLISWFVMRCWMLLIASIKHSFSSKSSMGLLYPGGVDYLEQVNVSCKGVGYREIGWGDTKGWTRLGGGPWSHWFWGVSVGIKLGPWSPGYWFGFLALEGSGQVHLLWLLKLWFLAQHSFSLPYWFDGKGYEGQGCYILLYLGGLMWGGTNFTYLPLLLA